MISDIGIGYLGIGVMLAFLFLGMPIYLATGIVGFLGMLWILGFDGTIVMFGTIPYQQSSYYLLMTIPLFVLMGNFTFHAGIGRALYDAANKFIGHFPGGLAMATVTACGGFAACSGSSIANAAAMGTITIPEMERHNYDRKLAVGTVAAGGTIGVMIPPSTAFIVYGVITEESIGKLFIAGIFPGLIMCTLYILTIFARVKINPRLAPPVQAFSWKERLAALRDLWMPIAIFLLVIGGLYIGYFTPTEGGAVGAFGTFIFVILRKRLSRKVMVDSLADTIRITALIFMIFIGAHMFGLFMALTGLPSDLSQWIATLPVSPYVILLAVLGFYIPLGMFMDFLAGMIVTLPILFPVIDLLGFNLIWFGVLMTLMSELGLITPPVGMNVYVLKGVTGLSLEDIFRGVIPFVVTDLIILTILLTFPQISLFLPGMMK